MNMFNVTSIVGAFIHDHLFIFIAAVLTLATLIFLHSKMGFLAQSVFIVFMMVIDQTEIQILMGSLLVLQVFLTLFVIYRLKKAIDRNYQLVLEKTHAIKRSITENDYTGSQKSFLH